MERNIGRDVGPESDRDGPRYPRYRFIVGVSVAALEQDLNRIAGDDPWLALRQIVYAQGTGFVAVLERVGHADQTNDPERRDASAEPGSDEATDEHRKHRRRPSAKA